MRYHFDDFDLDLERGLLCRDGQDVPAEPRVFALLALLVSNTDRIITKDEVIDAVWNGRVVSDAAIATVIKSTRKLLGDDGAAQKVIQTVRGRGIRFLSAVHPAAPAQIAQAHAKAPPDAPAPVSKPPSLAILPFRLVGYSEAYNAIADAIPTELISCLSRLRWLTVLARGSTFRFRAEEPDLAAIHAALGASYCLTGLVEIFGAVTAVSVELSDTRSETVIWSERFTGVISDIEQTRNDIVTHVISAMELHVPLNEANRARLRPQENLDAWGIYHLGLQHMYRFNRKDNVIAAGYFQKATTLDPAFARAYAAQSFTSFQSAFLKYDGDTAAEVQNAQRFAEKCLELDPVDPFGNFTLGRAYWLRGDAEAGMPWIDRSVILSPNFAHGFYAHGWGDVMAGRGEDALEHLHKAMALSPLDPFSYAMQSACGLAHLKLGQYEDAAQWAESGARAPGAHFLIGMIASLVFGIKGDQERSLHWAKSVQARRPDATIEMFFSAFPLEDLTMRREIASALGKVGFPTG